MFRFIYVSLFIIACWIWGDWKGWGKYYSTILYGIVCDLLYNFLFARYPLWEYHGGPLKNHTFNDIFIAFTLYPCIGMLYIPYFPDRILKQGLYILGCAALTTGIEALCCLMGLFHYFNGWNIGYSFIFDACSLFLVILHYKRPLLTWLMTGITITIVIISTGLPLGNLK